MRHVSAAGALAKLSCSGTSGASHLFTFADDEQEDVPVILHPFFLQSARLPLHCCLPEQELVESLAQLKQVSATGKLAKLSCSGTSGASHLFTFADDEQEDVPVILHPFFLQSARLPLHCCLPEQELVESLAQLKQVSADALPTNRKVEKMSAAALHKVIR